jgi:hypothetical protein
VLKYRGEELGKVFFKITKTGVLVGGDLKGCKVGAAGFEGAVVDVAVLADGVLSLKAAPPMLRRIASACSPTAPHWR